MGKVFGVVSLKGGVGKTSVVAALGSAIAKLNKKVLLIDGNLSAPNLGLYLKILNPEKTLHDVLKRETNIANAIHNFENFDVLPASLNNMREVNPLKLKDSISHLKRKYDVVLIDSSPSLNEETLGVMLASDGLLVVTTPDYPTLNMTLKAIKLAKQRGTKIDGLILNKVHNKNFEISIGDVERVIDVPVMAVIPHDINVLKSLSEFKSSTDYKPKSKSSEEYGRLAASLVGEKYKPIKFGNIFRKINPRRQDINRTIFYENVFKN